MTEQQGDLEGTPRFERVERRRDFLGLAAAWTAGGTLALAALGSLRLPMPAVFPESNPRVKLGRPDRFATGSATYFAEHRLWLFRAERGFHALSSVCTHLGCIVTRGTDGAFKCPCHGSRFDASGAVTGGPAPKGLAWVEMSLSPEGALIADTLREVAPGTMFEV
jgi:nitrite reductase/ring-hydroxylating ferredoxin subunit